MKRVYYFIRTYIKDFVTAGVGVIGALISLKYGKTIAIQQLFSLGAILLTTVFLIYLRSREKSFVFSALTWRKDKEEWMGHGTFQFARVQNAYEITHASPGYIHSKILSWSDYKLSFDFKIDHDCLGVVVRAVNLANYIMLQIKPGGIRPHIFVNGAEVHQEAEDAGLVFTERLILDNWYHSEIYCDKSIITIRLYEKNKKIFDRTWEITRDSLIFMYKHSEEYSTVHFPFPVTLEYGSIGFRNYYKEKAYVKNVLIQKLLRGKT